MATGGTGGVGIAPTRGGGLGKPPGAPGASKPFRAGGAPFRPSGPPAVGQPTLQPGSHAGVVTGPYAQQPGPHGPYAPTTATINAPPHAPAPAPPDNSSSTTPGDPPPSPLDSTYFAELNRATTDANTQIRQYSSSIDNSRTNLQNALDQMAYQNSLNTVAAQNAENARGGFAQGALGNQLGQIQHGYVDQTAGATLTQGQQEAAWQAAITGAQEGLGATDLALRAASAARATAHALTDNVGAGGGGGTKNPNAYHDDLATSPGGGGGSGAPGSTPGTTAPSSTKSGKAGAYVDPLAGKGGGRSQGASAQGASAPAVQALARALANRGPWQPSRGKRGGSGGRSSKSGGAGY